MITMGKDLDLAVDLILTVSEIDEILRWASNHEQTKLKDKLETCAKAIRFEGVRKIGYIDQSRLNWE